MACKLENDLGCAKGPNGLRLGSLHEVLMECLGQGKRCLEQGKKVRSTKALVHVLNEARMVKKGALNEKLALNARSR